MQRSTSCVLLVIVMLALAFPGVALARSTVYYDPLGQYEISIPASWVYQVNHSEPSLLVFYGSGSSDVLYIETIGSIQDDDVESLANRIWDVYKSSGGYGTIKMEESIVLQDLAGIESAMFSYSFTGASGTRQIETRVVAIENGKGYSIAVADSIENFHDLAPRLASVLAGWRWSKDE